MYGSCGIALCALTAYTYYRSLIVFLAMLPLGLLYPCWKRKALARARMERLRLEFRDGIVILASSLSAGYSVENAFLAGCRELEQLHGENSMIAEEFQRICAQMRMNQPVEPLLLDFGRRSCLEEVNSFAQVFAAAKRSGGNLTSVISHTAQVIRDRTQLREELMSITAQKQLEQRIMNGLPYFLVLYLDVTSPGFFQLMYNTVLGRVVMTLCLAVYITALILAGKILDIQL